MPKDRNATLNDASKAPAASISHDPSPYRHPSQSLPPNTSSLAPVHATNAKSLPHAPATNMQNNTTPRNETSSLGVINKSADPSVENGPNHPKTDLSEQKTQPRTTIYVNGQSPQTQPSAVPAHPQDVHAYYHPSVIPTYIPTHPQDSAASHSHYPHHPSAAHWAPTHASPYTWLPTAAPQPGQPTPSHHPHQIHTPYGVGHVSVSPTPYPVPGPGWSSHPSYLAPITVAGTHFTHYYPSVHPTHMQGHHYPHPAQVTSVPPTSNPVEGSSAKGQQDTNGAPVAGVQSKTMKGGNSSVPETAKHKSERPTNNESKDLREKPGGIPKPIRGPVDDGSQNGNSTRNEENSNANYRLTTTTPVVAVTNAPKESSTTKRTQNNTPSVQQPIRKTRKPYTKTKNRESWTEKEHQLFLQALTLYNRDWKRIETFIGTKTVLQIRSHAQKHFCKVTKYKTGEYIPPPRPKRRASRPYPRSRGVDVPEKMEKNAETNAQKNSEGAKTASDSCAGSSENGNVSGNGKSSSNGSVESVANSTLPSGQPSNAAVNSNDKNLGTRDRQPQSGPSSSGFHPAQKPSVSPSMQCYNPYYYNTARANPNSLPYPPGYYQNHYSQPPVPVTQPHPFYACYDQNCSHYNSYQGHGHVHLTHPSLPPLHAQSTHPHAPSPYPHHPTVTTPHLPPTTPKRPGESGSVRLADDAAARRAHRAKIIRGRKSSIVKNIGQESDEAREPEIISVEHDKTSDENKVESPSDEKKVRNSSNEKPATVASLLNSSSQEPRSNVLMGSNTGSAITGLLDVGSDEAVAGFSGSDGQGSGSDGSPQEGQERSGTPEEDPNSSSGDDGRGRNTRGSSPTDPNSGGSREDTPCQNEINGSRNASPQNGDTPTQSRETTPSENAVPVQSGKKSTQVAAAAAATDRGGNPNVHLEAAEALLKYRNSKQQKTGAVNKKNTSHKAGINNLLNNSPQMVDVQRPPPVDQKRSRSPPNEVGNGESSGKGGTGRYKDEPSSQRRRHNSAEVDPAREGH